MPTMTVGSATEGSKGDADSSFELSEGQLVLMLADDGNDSGAISGVSMTTGSIGDGRVNSSKIIGENCNLVGRVEKTI